MKYLGIDIGYYNIGLAFTECIGPHVEVIFVGKVDLTHFKTKQTPELSDMVHAFVTEYSHVFCDADKILIERQPPGGFSSIEVLLHYIFRHKAILISPLSMHKHFGIGHLTYEQRKERTELIASKYINNFQNYDQLSRKHDIADALCMILFQNYKDGITLKKQGTKQLFENFRMPSKL
jgi:Holliday junction resolvasome RuvABC endonuclease subunit